ncbi:MAG TPA: MFS transporter [Deltaproteobacteria bacterium]|nr:MFS transporter [Deltaproteobacteria bacterium]
MRAFHMTWIAFFLSFFAWFAVAPLMAVIREDLHLTQAQIGNTVIASVAVTIFVRLLAGKLCDRFGPRRVYSVLLLIGALPVMGIGLARDYQTFLFFRLAIGGLGASFVVTQYHTSVMFAPNVVGTANATTAGWGNLGGGVTQMVMPLLLAAFVGLGAGSALGWRLAMVVPGLLLAAAGVAYFVLTQDTPEGAFERFRAREGAPRPSQGTFRLALGDPRVWILFVVYGACFGLEITVDNVAALYFHDHFNVGLKMAGLIAGLFGTMNLFARTLGGWLSDRSARRIGFDGRARLLTLVLLGEGVFLVLFSRTSTLAWAIPALLTFALFTKMSNGATYAVVPFVKPRALGSVSGIVGAGGNVGAVCAGLLFRAQGMAPDRAFLYLGSAVLLVSGLSLALRFPTPAPSLGVETSSEHVEIEPA